MKKIIKVVIALLCVLATLSGTVGCREQGGVVVDEGKVSLLVGNFKGGYGSAWLNKAVSRFEAQYADVDFGGGKKGVQVIVDDNARYSGDMTSKLSGYPQHVILAENVNYYDMVNVSDATSKYLVDISDVVNTPVNKDFITGATSGSDSYTVADIMNSSMKDYLDAGNDTYYGVPFYEATVGIVYDLDVFEKYGFFFAAEGYGDSEGVIQDVEGNWIGASGTVLGNASSMTYEQALAAGVKLGNGPDGQSGTYDDGCPATYDDFFKMCLRMDARDVFPLTWPGTPEIQRYLNYLAYNLWTDYEGVDQMSLNYTLNGTATDLIEMSSYNSEDGSYEVESVAITDKNGYELQRQAGKYEAINFIKRILSDERNYDAATCIGEVGQKDAERRFILSALPEEKDRAMLIDGSWWQNEASSIFSDMAVDYGNDAYRVENRRYGMLPLPKANESKVGEGNTLSFNTATVIVVNKASVKDDVTLTVAKQFIKFLHTHESLYEFNKITASARPYDYTLTETELSSLTSVAKQNYELHTATDFVFSYSKHPIVRKNPARFACSGYLVFEAFDNLESILAQRFINNPSTTSWQYFTSMVNDHGKQFWDTNFGDDFT